MLGYIVHLLAFNASCIDRPFPVEMTPSSTAPEGLASVGLCPRYGSEVLAALDTSAGDFSRTLQTVIVRGVVFPGRLACLDMALSYPYS
jgi:hypothetical protein